jgi:hypothetical protein
MFAHCTLENLKETLDTYGVAVLQDVLPQEDVAKLRSLAWENIKEWSDGLIDIDDQNSWKNLFKFYPKHAMLVQEYGVGHMQWLWDIRQHPNVIEVFKHIWGTENLLVSFDAMSIHFPPEVTNRGWFRGTQWYHTDSNPERTEQCVQSLINLYPVNEHDATLSVLEGSHKYHQEFFKKFPRDVKGDWYKLASQEEIDFFLQKGCQMRDIQAGPGSMVLWYSKTFHQGKEPSKQRLVQNTRLISYVCMTPRSWARESDINKKRKAFENRRTTSHWPHMIKLFPNTPRTYGGEKPPNTKQIPRPELTDMGKKLAGF